MLSLCKEVYGREYDKAATAAEKSALAGKVLRDARETNDDPTSRFVLLRLARDVAAEAADAPIALSAIDEMARLYQVDGLEMKVQAVGTMAQRAKLTTQRALVAKAALGLIDPFIAADEYDVAKQLADVAVATAVRAREADLRKHSIACQKEVEQIARAYEQVRDALATLDSQPTDPQANLAVGKFFCLAKGDWAKGIPMLALGSDPQWKALATNELQGADSPDQMLALADGWWDLAQEQEGTDNTQLQIRAAVWYQQALPGLTGLLQAKARNRLGQIAQTGRPIPEVSTPRPQPRRTTAKSWDLAKVQLQRTLEGHTDVVDALAFSPDGSLLASGSADNTVRLWDPDSGELRQTFQGHTDSVHSVAFSPDGSTLASSSADKTVRLWDVAAGRVRQTLHGHAAAISSVACAPDGSVLASGSSDKTLRLWDIRTGALRATLTGHRDKLYTVAFSPRAPLLASGSADKTVILWDLATGRPLRTLGGHGFTVTQVTFSPDGSLLASASSDRTIRLWDAATGQTRRTLLGHKDFVRAAAFSPDGLLLASGGNDQTVRLWPVDGEDPCILTGHTGVVLAVAFRPAGSLLASAGQDKTIRLWAPAP